MKPNVVAIIPARLSSTRLPRKVLLCETGKPLIRHVYEGVQGARGISRTIVATDSEEVRNICQTFGAECVMTSESCQSGTDRVAEAAREMADAALILNVQGDEPEMMALVLERLVAAMLNEKTMPEMGTIASPWPSDIPVENPGAVKVVTNSNGYALYFSRSSIPYIREVSMRGDLSLYRKHVGIYAYRPDFLQTFAKAPPERIELAEGLEQLRALALGARILVAEAPYSGLEVNTPEDYAAFVRRYADRLRL